MTRDYNPSVRPPETYELVPALATLIEASADVQNLLGDLGTVDRHEFSKPPSATAPWLRVLVREPWIPYVPESSQAVRWVPVEIVVQASAARVDGWDPYLSSSALHAAVYEAIVGQSPALEYAGVVLPLQRQTAPTRPVYDDGHDAYESTSVYRITLKPAN